MGFYLILSAVQPNVSAGMFWRLLIGTVVMLIAGYCGEAGLCNPTMGFVVGMAGWGFILFEIFAGEAGKVAAGDEKVSEHVKKSFSTMRLIVTIGWSIYPLGSWRREGERAREEVLQHHALDCHHWLVHLPSG